MRGPADFNKIMATPPRCPLCFGPMENAWDGIRKMNILVCHKDRIAISVMDPMVGRWEQDHEKIECPNCNAEMRVFFTSTGFMMARCPKKRCGCTVKGSNPDRFTMPGALKLDGVGPETIKEQENKEPKP